MSGTCPACGTVLDAPDESVDRQLAALIDAGCDSDLAAEKVVASLPDAHRLRVLPVMRREAHRVARGRDCRVEHATMSTEERWRKSGRDLRAKLLQIELSLGNGEKVAWGKATLKQLQRRRDMYAQQRAGIDAGDSRVELAMNMIRATPGARCLEDIEGSEKILIGVEDDASAEVDTNTGGTARRPMTSTDTSRRPRRKGPPDGRS